MTETLGTIVLVGNISIFLTPGFLEKSIIQRVVKENLLHMLDNF